MLALISFLFAVTVSALIVRIGSIALELTGLSKDVAYFQALSAFTGAGFTTAESEFVINHPVRRRIIKTLMFLGNAGITTMIVTLVLTFIGRTAEETSLNLILISLGLLIIYVFFKSSWVERWMRKIIKKFLLRIEPELRVADFHRLLGIEKGYEICRMKVKRKSWLANKRVGELGLEKEGVIILGILRRRGLKEYYIGIPRKDIKILPGDIVICYGPDEIVTRLSKRLKGEKGKEEHIKAVEMAKKKAREEKEEIEKMKTKS